MLRQFSGDPAPVQRRVQEIRNSSGHPGWAAQLFLHPRQPRTRTGGEACRNEQSSTRASAIVVVKRSRDRSAANRTQKSNKTVTGSTVGGHPGWAAPRCKP